MISIRNAKLTILASFLSDLAFILPIWLLFGTNQLGFSVTMTTALFMVVWLGSGLLEVPTGALADRLGRKRMFLIGASLLALYPIVYIFEASIPLIFIVSAFAAFGSALRSGTLVALTHDSFKKDKRSDEDYHAFLSNQQTATFIARALSGVTGGLLYAYNPHAPYIAIFIAYVLMVLAGMFIKDTTIYSSNVSNRTHVAAAARAMWKKEIIVLLIASYMAFQFVGEAMWTAYQPFFEADGVSPAAIGLIFSVIALISAAGSYSTRHLMKKYGVLLIEFGVSVAILISAFMLFLPSETIRILAIIPSAFMFGVALTPMTATIQKHVDQKLHSTALSVSSLVQYAGYGISSIYISIIIDSFGLEQTRKILFVEAILVVVILGTLYIKNRGKDEIITPKSETVII